MYPIHRKNLLKKIKTCLENGQNCRVIATSLVEAGVDLDFKRYLEIMQGIALVKLPDGASAASFTAKARGSQHH